ncbi:FkbM family methyltransferase [Hyphomicrobium sp.]|uniref:FkbM family methyltransferase n=1 Tax=Hyphomicrobium sp. TaxID=82 RepID=UPI002D7659A9|nr:FkbM family methyltransferase [Hyphomicrobium sp.]HET6390227.1 FkbM family methyltransferase [Hyphomicrobium sp.]
MQNALRTMVSQLAWKLAPRHMHDRHLAQDKFAECEEGIIGNIVDRHRGSIDVGANLGRYTIRLARCTDFVIAFEPHVQVAKLLRDLVRRERLDNVTIIEMAASAMPDRALPLFLPSKGAGCAGHSTLEGAAQSGAVAEAEVRTATLDQFADRDIGFVKIDVEGHEYDVLRGSERLIEANAPIFMIEIENLFALDQIARVREFMGKRGYRGSYIYNGRLHDIDGLDPRLQDRSALDWSRPRREMEFVNNFFFVREGSSSEQFAERMAAALAATSN